MNQIINQLYKNWKKYQIHIILLILLLIFLVLYRIATTKGKGLTMLSSKQTNKIEGFENENTPIPSSTQVPEDVIEPSILNSIFFIKNFPKQEIVNVWSSKNENGKYISFWERSSNMGYEPIGQSVLVTDYEPSVNDLKETVNGGLQYLIKGGQDPIDYEKIWDNQHIKDQPPLSIWKLLTPPNTVAMSDIAVAGYDKPTKSNVKCIPLSILVPNGKINGDDALWKSPNVESNDNSSPEHSLSVWDIGSYGFFFAKDSFQKPQARSDKIMDVKSNVLNNYEYDHLDGNKIIKVTLKI
jgi:hypothetical protein